MNPEIWVAFLTLLALEVVLGIDNFVAGRDLYALALGAYALGYLLAKAEKASTEKL
jgi:hypothetical protein